MIMVREILIESLSGETRLAVIEDGALMELYAERAGQDKLSGNIYAGRVENVLPGMNAAFVDIGLEKNAFLYAGDIQLDSRDAQELASQLNAIRIEKLVRPGQQVLVQVVKEPGGTKGPRISSHVTLPGRRTVLLPSVRYTGVSRRIEDDDERARLREIAVDIAAEAGMGLIVRTAAQDSSAEEIRADFHALTRLWDTIRTRGEHVKAPALLHRDESLAYRAVRDMLSPEVEAIYTDDEAIYRQLTENTALLTPELLARIHLYSGEAPLFDAYRVDAQADKALQHKVWLKSGGYLVIDYTEALTVIDVNTGKYVGKKSLSDTVFQTNCEAATEIARQLRLRDIGGIIVIDFIDMDTPEQRQKLLGHFKECLKTDRTRTNLAGLTSLGLVEMTRKKVRQPVHKLLYHVCDGCQGSGMVPTYETLARRILRDIRRRIAAGQTGAMLVTAAPPVATTLWTLEAPHGAKLFAATDEALALDEYAVSAAPENRLPPGTKQLKEATI